MSLLALPREILYSIFYQTEDVRSIFAVGCCSAAARDCVDAEGVRAVQDLLQLAYGPECAFMLRIIIEADKRAYDEFKYHPFWEEMGAENLPTLYKSERMKAMPLLSVSKSDTMAMARLHEHVDQALNEYVSTSFRARAEELRQASVSEPALSPSETHRLRRALLHYEILCRIFCAGYPFSDMDIGPQQYEAFTTGLPLWERDEMYSIVAYMEYWWWAVVGDFICPDAIDRLVARRCGQEAADIYKSRYDPLRVEASKPNRLCNGQFHSCTELCDPRYRPGYGDVVAKVTESIPLVRSIRTYATGGAVASGCASRGLAFYSRICNLKSWDQKQDFLDSWCSFVIFDEYEPFTGYVISALRFDADAGKGRGFGLEWSLSTAQIHENDLNHESHANVAWRWTHRASAPTGSERMLYEFFQSEEPRWKSLADVWLAEEDLEDPDDERFDWRMSTAGLFFWDCERLARWRIFKIFPNDVPTTWGRSLPDRKHHLERMRPANSWRENPLAAGQSRYERFRPSDAPEGSFRCGNLEHLD